MNNDHVILNAGGVRSENASVPCELKKLLSDVNAAPFVSSWVGSRITLITFLSVCYARVSMAVIESSS